MADYIGEKCIVCGRTFKKGDDIVVCPDCGTPYHRECWNKNGKCINDSLHAVGKSWYEEKINTEKVKNQEKEMLNRKQENQTSGRIVCRECGNVNPPNATNCINCGAPLPRIGDNNENNNRENSQNNPSQNSSSSPFVSYEGSQMNVIIDGKNVKIDFADPYGGLDPNDDFDGAKVSNTAEFIGGNPVRRVNFLILFMKFRKGISKVSTNLACLFFPEFYYAYRKVWSMFFILTGAFLLLNIPYILNEILTVDAASFVASFAQANTPEYSHFLAALTSWQELLEPHKTLISNLSVICNGLDFGIRVFLFFFGNYIYYRYATKKIKKLQNQYNGDRLREEIAIEGGTSVPDIIGGVAIKALLTVVLIVIVVAIVAAAA